MREVLLPSTYFGSIDYFEKIINYDLVRIEHCEHFEKQTLRNRCIISGPNGLLNLSIPILHKGERQIIKNVKIASDENWQKLHWRSIQTAYRSSPYFEFYEHDLAPLFEKYYEYLVTFNTDCLSLIINFLQLNNKSFNVTSEYKKEYNDTEDLRKKFSPKTQKEIGKNMPRYIQVFEDRNDFTPNLSILDLLFNEGPTSIDYLKNL